MNHDDEPPTGPLLDDAALDRLLDASPALEPSAQLMRRVAELPLTHPQRAPLRELWPFASALRLVLSGALLLALGAASALWSAGTAQADDALDELSGLMLGSDLDLEEAP
jgi:hypothetical protein